MNSKVLQLEERQTGLEGAIHKKPPNRSQKEWSGQLQVLGEPQKEVLTRYCKIGGKEAPEGASKSPKANKD